MQFDFIPLLGSPKIDIGKNVNSSRHVILLPKPQITNTPRSPSNLQILFPGLYLFIVRVTLFLSITNPNYSLHEYEIKYAVVIKMKLKFREIVAGHDYNQGSVRVNNTIVPPQKRDNLCFIKPQKKRPLSLQRTFCVNSDRKKLLPSNQELGLKQIKSPSPIGAWLFNE